MNKDLRIGRKFLCLVIAIVMVMTLIPRLPASLAYAAAGDTPAHTKNLVDNGDGTYTISLDVVGDSEKKPNNVNVIVILDHSGSMGERTGSGWSSPTRMSAAQSAVNNLANSLFAYNTSENQDTVEMALVGFSTNATVNRAPTTDYSQFSTSVNNLRADGGTNWEAALDTAAGVDFNDQDPTFVIFVSDGLPTFRDSANGYTSDYQWRYGVYGDGQEGNQNVARCYATAETAAKNLVSDSATSNTSADRFYTIFAYGGDAGAQRMNSLTTAAGAGADHAFNASDTSGLQAAFATILAQIEMSGIANTEIEDGTTNQVTTSSGEIAELLELVPNFKYYRSGGTYGTMQEWADAPEAKVVDGKVEWDLDEVGVLENGVKYTVTFDVYPSQYTYDTIAKLKNGDITYDSLDPEVKKYIVDNGGGSYSLRTNTDATLSYDDTRTDEKEEPIGYKNPEPVGTDASSLTINKEWEGGDAPDGFLPITVLMDGDEFHTAQLSGPDWETSTFISFGIIKGDTVLTGAEGHDFSFAELDDTQYRWELDAPVVHPMIIDGEPTVLVKVDETHTAPSDAKTYTIDGDTYYVDSAVGGLTATNYRRSNLNLTKVVTGEDAPEDAKFPFTLTVNNSKAPDAEPADDTDHNSDYWVWFSIYDTVAGETVTDAAVSGATGPSADGYYYAPSGSAITVDMQAGWNLRFTNLPSGTTYTFAETMPQGFAFKEAELTEGEDSTFSGGQTTTGTIETTKTSYYVEYTNDYQLTNLEITKKWEDNDDQDGKRPTPEEFKAWLQLLADGTDVTSDNVSKLTVTDGEDEEGNAIYTAKWTGLDRFAEGEEIEYSVTETPSEDYTADKTTAADGDTITNTHTPEVTEAEVEKVWDDNDDQDGMRPNKLVMTLSNGQTVTLSEDNDWTARITGLPKYANGELIPYTWTEEEVKEYTAEDPAVEGTKTTFTNVHTPIVIDIEGEKTWSDDDDRDGYRPEKITVNLLADGEKVDSLEVTPDEDGNWKYAFEDVPKFANGEEIVYTVTEEKVDKYDPTIDGFNIKNTHDSEKVNVSVEKVWDDDENRDGIRPASVTVTLLANGETATKEIAGTENATVTLSEDNDWSYEWEGLYKNSEGEEIEYTVVETAVEGYTPEIKPAGEEGSEEGEDPAAGDDTVQPADPGDQAEETTEPTEPTQNGEEQEETPATGYIITNVHDPEKIEITVTKTWNDDDDRDGKRPGSITFNLLANGEACKSASVTAEDEWTYTFEDLFKYEKGQEIAYTVTEEKVDDYETTVDGYEVTNKHVLEETTITVTKNWDDADDRDGIRPENVTVTLLANGDDVTQEGIEATVELSKDNDWTYTWEGLYKYEEGTEIAYTVQETAVDGYEAIITGDAAGGYQIKNYHLAKPEPIMIDPPVKKVVNGSPKTNETFTFQMKAVTEGAPMPAGAKDGVMTMQITGSGEKEFGEAWISEAGKYVYEITEVKGSAEGYTYDSTVYTLTVDVEEVAEGTQVKLVKTETVTGGNGTIIFTNEYKEPATPTGDTTIVMPYVVIGISALILLIMLLFKTRKNRA